MAEQKTYVDYNHGGDTGQDNVDSIQPVMDGEGATQTVLGRPAENLRTRTELTRDTLNALMYYRDSSHLIIQGSAGHTITWAGSTTDGHSGLITQSGDLTIRPLLTPSTSTKGKLAIGTAGVNQLTYTVSAGGYATEGMNAILVEHRDAGGGAALSCTISDGPVKRILVQFDATNTGHDAATTKATVDAAIFADADLTGKLTITTSAVASQTIAASAEARVEGTADQEAHVLASGLLTSFTTTNPLAEGHAIGIWYRYLVEPVGGFGSDPKGGVAGGRAESNPDRATSTIPLASLFITDTNPEKIPGAVPLCKVVGGELVWLDHSRFGIGITGPIGTTSAVSVDASSFAGNKTLVNNGGITTPLSPPTAQAAFDSIDSALGNLRAFTYVCTDGVTSTGGDFNSNSAVKDAIDALGGSGGTLLVRRGAYTLPNNFVMGNGKPVTVIGEDRESVVLQQAAPVAWSIESEFTLQNVRLDSAVQVQLQASANNVTLKDIYVSNSNLRISVAGTRCTLSNVTWITDGPTGSTAIDLTGKSCKLDNLYVRGHVDLQGTNNIVSNLKLKQLTNSLTLAKLAGTNNTFQNVYVDEVTVDAATANDCVVTLGGNNVLIDNLYVDTRTGAALTQGAAVGLDASTSVTGLNVRNAKIRAGIDNALLILDSGANTYDAHFDCCKFENLSTTRHTVSVTNVSSGLVFTNCIFNDNEQFGNSVVSLAEALNDYGYNEFVRCEFYGATFNNTAAGVFCHATFRDCLFVLKNPVDGGLGVRTLPGVDQGATTGLWRFSGTGAISTRSKMACKLENCTFDFLDSEVINAGTGTPSINHPFIAVDATELKSCVVKSLNLHCNIGTGAIVGLSSNSIADDVRLYWTTTAGVQTGTIGHTGWFRVSGDNVTIRNLIYPNLVGYSGTLDAGYITVAGACANLVIRDCVFAAQTVAPLTPSGAPTGNGYENWLIDNVSFGTSANYIGSSAGNVLIPLHKYCTWSNNKWYVFNQITFGVANADSISAKFINNSIYSPLATPYTTSPLDVTGVTFSGLVFCGNYFSYLSTLAGPATRSLFSGAPASVTNVSSAGNIFLDRKPVSTDDGTIALTAVNDGLP